MSAMRGKVWIVERRNRRPNGRWTGWFVTYESYANPFRRAAKDEQVELKRTHDETWEFRVALYEGTKP